MRCRYAPLLPVLIHLSPGTDQVAHGLYVGGIAGERQTAEFPAALDGCEHRVVVVRDVRGARRVVRVRDGQRDDVPSACPGTESQQPLSSPNP